MTLAVRSLVAGVVCALVSFIAYFVYAGLAGPPRPDYPKILVYLGMPAATVAVGALAWAAADASGVVARACTASRR